MLVHELLENAADRHPERPAAWHLNAWIAYGELEERANRIANALLSRGLGAGDRVGVLMDNGFDFLACHFAVSKAGGVNVSLNTELPPDGLAALLADCDARFLLAGRKQAKILGPLGAGRTPLEHVLWDGDALPESAGAPEARHSLLKDAAAEASPARPAPRRIDLDLATLVYTSGSTGKPKGVMLSHLNLMSNTRSVVGYLGLTGEDRILAVLPFYYIYGQSLFYTHFAVGGSVLIENRFAYPNVALDTMAKLEATGFAGVPSTFMILLNKSNLRKSAFPRLRYVTQAGGHMAPQVQKEAAEAFHPAKLYVMYGTTEASPRLTWLEPELLPAKLGSIGRAVPNVDVFIADERGNRLPPGTLGEIAARGSNIMMGYWRDPAGTAEVLRDGIYFTGDLGREDADGCLFIEGRSKDILKVGGNRVGAREIEDAILAWGHALEAAVIGVEDPILGEAVKAFVVPRGSADMEALKAHLKERLPAYKQPKYVQILDSLPKNAAGKVMKTELRKLGAAPEAIAPL